MAKLVPYLMSDNAREQAQFYVQALGGEILHVQTYGEVPDTPADMKEKVIHLHAKVAGVDLYMSDAVSPMQKPGRALALSLDFDNEDEARSAFAKLSEGGKVQHPLEPVFWGAIFGDLEDKFGVVWMVNHDPSGRQGAGE